MASSNPACDRGLYKFIDLNLKNIFYFKEGNLAKELHSDFVVNEFELQSHNCAYFRSNTLGKGMNPRYVPPVFFYKDGFGIE